MVEFLSGLLIGTFIGIIVAIFFILGGGIFAYKKYNNLKGI